jgi:hypothetical protein
MRCVSCDAVVGPLDLDPRKFCAKCSSVADAAERVRLDALGAAMGLGRDLVNYDTLSATGAALGVAWDEVTVEAIAAKPAGVRDAVAKSLTQGA